MRTCGDHGCGGKGVGSELYKTLLRHSKGKSIERPYLLTDTARDYYFRLDFSQMVRDGAPDRIKNSEEFSTLCPDTAKCMVQRIGDRRRHLKEGRAMIWPDRYRRRPWKDIKG